MSVFVLYLIYYIYKGLWYLWIRNLPNTPGCCHFSPASAGVLLESLSVHWNTMVSTTFPSLVSGCCLQLWSLAYGFYSITDIYFMYIGVTSGFLSEAAWSAWPPSPWTDNQTQTDLCNTRTHWLCTGKRSTGKQWTFLEHNRSSLRNSGKLFLCCIWNHKQKSHTKRISFPDDYFLRHTLSGMTMLPFSNIHSLSSMIVSGQRITFFILIIHALVSSVLPYALYSLSMRYMEAGKASILASSEPAAAMLFGAVLYAETPGILSICGLCFTITAVILLNYERNWTYGTPERQCCCLYE